MNLERTKSPRHMDRTRARLPAVSLKITCRVIFGAVWRLRRRRKCQRSFRRPSDHEDCRGAESVAELDAEIDWNNSCFGWSSQWSCWSGTCSIVPSQETTWTSLRKPREQSKRQNGS